jgi:flagellar hook-length control protein FliK
MTDAVPARTPVPASVAAEGLTGRPAEPLSSTEPRASASELMSGVDITVDASATPVTSTTSAIGIETLGRAALLARAADSAIAGEQTETDTSASTATGPVALGAVDGEVTRPAGSAAETAATESASPAPVVEAAPRRVSFAEAAQGADPALPSEPTAASKSEVRMPLSLPSISVDLSDEGLGPMQLQARQGPDGLHLSLTAADREVGAALARAGAELRRDLEAAGTTVGSLDIGQGSRDGTGQRQGRADDGGLSGGTRGAVSLGAITASTTSRPPLITTTRTSSADAGLDLLI